MNSSVLDASALLALLNQEPGGDQVEAAVTEGATVGAVNLSEVVAKLLDAGMPETSAREALELLGLTVIDFDAQLAYAAAGLRPSTRKAGLSLGDRACLALGQQLGIPVLTADRRWRDLGLEVEVRAIRG